ncbi:hypothetical protein HGRIS_012626 [Hohenbuehelia grisea]|uniref:Uncharacterized protein n=1 Tax=Hohenbuehelia grisea TaxID=104357 RepID=A0ABR3ISU9_9AGAR
MKIAQFSGKLMATHMQLVVQTYPALAEAKSATRSLENAIWPRPAPWQVPAETVELDWPSVSLESAQSPSIGHLVDSCGWLRLEPCLRLDLKRRSKVYRRNNLTFTRFHKSTNPMARRIVERVQCGSDRSRNARAGCRYQLRKLRVLNLQMSIIRRLVSTSDARTPPQVFVPVPGKKGLALNFDASFVLR